MAGTSGDNLLRESGHCYFRSASLNLSKSPSNGKLVPHYTRKLCLWTLSLALLLPHTVLEKYEIGFCDCQSLPYFDNSLTYVSVFLTVDLYLDVSIWMFHRPKCPQLNLVSFPLKSTFLLNSLFQ